MGLTCKRFEFGVDEQVWNMFIQEGKYKSFMFDRSFMDYHKERFSDHSTMVFNEKGIILACFPANQKEGVLYSHQGLSFGGFLFTKGIKLSLAIEVVQTILEYYEQNNILEIVYKKPPRIYATNPSDEDDYILFKLKAELIRRDTAIVINQSNRLPYQKRRLRSIKKAKKLNVRVKKSSTIDEFYNEILAPNLMERFGVEPVHTLKELILLKNRFNKNIIQYNAYSDTNEIIAGCTIFYNRNIVHAQYISSSKKGRDCGAIDFLFDEMIDKHFESDTIFDFGICNEENGQKLNSGLLDWKESFGGNVVSHDFYRIMVNNKSNLSGIFV